jgi:hypothetical protein
MQLKRDTSERGLQTSVKAVGLCGTLLTWKRVWFLCEASDGELRIKQERHIRLVIDKFCLTFELRRISCVLFSDFVSQP